LRIESPVASSIGKELQPYSGRYFPKTERGQQQLVELLVVAGRPNMVHILERVPEVITHEDVHDHQS
jgi:hypothetical protein